MILTQNSDIGFLDILKQKDTKVIYDCIDSYISDEYSFKGKLRGLAKFLNKDTKKLYFNYARSLKNKISHFDAVICASEEQSLSLSAYSDNIHPIPDMLNEGPIECKNDYKTSNEIKIVWEGLGTNAFHLRILDIVFKDISKKNNISLHVVTDPFHYKFMNKFIKRPTINEVIDLCDNVYLHDWEQSSFSKKIVDCDLAIIPLNKEDSLAYGKPENKLISLWKMGMPVITSQSDSYKRVMKAAGVDLCCNDDNDWITKLTSVISNENLRSESAIKGLTYSKENYSEDSVLSKWQDLFLSVI